MALAIDSQMPSGVGALATNATSLTYSFNNVAGGLLVCGAAIGGTNFSATNPTYASVSMGTADKSLTWNANGAASALFHLLSPATGSNTVVVTAANLTNAIMSGCTSFTGHNTSSPIVQGVSASTNSGTASVAVPGTAIGNIIIDCCGTGGGTGNAFTAQTQTPSWLKEFDTATAGDNAAGQTAAGTGGTVTMQYTVDPDLWGIVAIEIAALPPQTYNDSISESADARDAFPAVGFPISSFQSTALAFELDAFQIISGSGSTFNDSISETLTAADALQNVITWANSLTEARTAADSLTTTATFPNAFTEAGSAADSLIAGLVLTQAITEAGSATDSLVGGLLLAATVTEAASAADSLSNVVTWGPALTEAGSAADSLTTAATFRNALTEAGAAADALTAGLVFNESVTEQIGTTTVITSSGNIVIVFDD